MKKRVVCALLSGLMLAFACVSLFFLPDTLAVQWNAGEVSGTATKWMILVFPAMAGLLTASQTGGRSRASGWICLVVILLLFGAQAVIVWNALNLVDLRNVDFRFIQMIVLLLTGAALVFFGNRLPKYAKNYYIGVKAAAAYFSEDLWTKTQRFAGKLWVISGIIIMLLSVIPWDGISTIVILMILLTAYLPRIYCGREYEKLKNR